MRQTGKHEQKKCRLPLRAYLLYLLVASFLLTGVTFSKYITSSGGGDEARVASMKELTLTESGDFTADKNHKAHIIPGVALTKRTQISYGGSEAAAYVFVSLALSEGWSQKTDTTHQFAFMQDSLECMSFAVDSGWTFLKKDSNTNQFVFYKTVVPNEVLTNVDVIAGEGAITVSEEISESVMAALSGEITVTIQATAVQSGGFSSVDAAWTSVSEKH